VPPAVCVYSRSQAVLLLQTGLEAALPQIPLSPERYGPFLHYVSEEAAALNSVRDIVQTQDGYLLLTTDSGLCRFQGLVIHNYTKENTPALRTNELHHLVDDRKGGVWFSSADGLYHISGDTISAYTSADGLLSNQTLAPLPR
jgi:ligand-binding sensor domain-containing protein